MAIDKDKIETIEDKSYFFQDILEKTPAWIIVWGNTVFLMIFVCFLLGLIWIEYPDVIVGEAKVLTKNPSINVYSESSGQITHILKQDREHVKKDEWILILDNSADYTSILKFKKIIKLLDTPDFWKEINRTQLEDRLRLGTLNGDYLKLIRSISEYQLFKKLNPQFSQIEINKSRFKNLEEMLLNLKRQQVLLEQEVDIVLGDYKRTKQLFEEKAVATIEVEQKEMEWLTAKSKLEELNSLMLNVQQEQQVIHKENTSLIIEQSDRYLELRNNILSHFNRLLFLLKEWEQKNVLLAPVDGILNMYDIRSKKQFLLKEQHVFTISPIGKQHYYAWVKMPIGNSGKVKAKQKVIIKLSNYPYQEFGALKGTVLSITNVPKEGSYMLKVELPMQLVTSSKQKLDEKQELIGRAEIITEDLSLFTRMFNFLNK